MDDGVRFAIREGGKTVGSGVVTKILDVVRLARVGELTYRGVAQLAERWSPKPEVASSIPAAPASQMIGDAADGRVCKPDGQLRRPWRR